MGKRPILPEQRNYEQALSQALQIAREKLSNSNVSDFCRNSGMAFTETPSGRVIALKYAGQEIQVTLPHAEVLVSNGREKLPSRERLLVLHYLLSAKGRPLTNKLITLKEIPDGLNYLPTFTKRALKPLVDNFGQEPGRIVEIAGKIGGRKADHGDAAATIDVFPRVPLTFVIWQGDTEFQPDASILFDSSITDYLPVEDIIVMSEITVWKLVNLSRNV